MIEDQPILNPEVEMQNAVEILTALQNCGRFQTASGDDSMSRIQLMYGDELSANRYYPTEDFLRAVDYYCENRDSRISVNLAMKSPNGVVNVWSPFKRGNEERKVVVSVKNHMVPQILEFAYLILREKAKRASQTESLDDSTTSDTSS